MDTFTHSSSSFTADDTSSTAMESTTATVELTLLQNTTGEPVSKTIRRDPVTGDMHKFPGRQICNGNAWRVHGRGAAGLAWRLAQTKAHELLINAQLRCGDGTQNDPAVPIRVMLKDDIVPGSGMISRSPEFFSLPQGQPGCLVFDVDYKGISTDLRNMIDYLSPWGALLEVFSDLKGTARVERASCGAGLLWQGQPLPDSGGMHIWPMIRDASDAPRAMEVAFKRCVLNGLYWGRVSRRGTVLIRSLIDMAMKNIAQPVFEGAPCLLQTELTQNRTMRWWEGKLVNTRVVFPDLTPAEEAEYHRVVAAEKMRLEPEAQIARAEWIKLRAEADARANGRTAPDASDYQRAENLCNSGDRVTLTASSTLLFDDRSLGVNGVVTVREVLRDPERYIGKTMADPLDWEDGPGHAKLHLQRDGGLIIHSFSHGETNYFLRWEAADVSAFLRQFVYGSSSLGSFLRAYADIVTRAQIEPLERKAFNKHAAELSDVTVTKVNRALERNMEERAKMREPVDPETADLEEWERQDGILERVAELNRDYAHVLIEGKGFVYYKATNKKTGYTGWTSAAVGSFNEVISGPKYFTGPDYKNLHNAAFCWTQHSRRRWYPGGVDMDSKAAPDPTVLNLWEGFAFEPAPGDWSKTKEFIEKIVCGGIKEEYEYLFNHMAWKYQNPTERTEMAKVFRGGQGIGKGFFMRKVFGPAFGRHFISLETPEQLVGRFNDHLANACVVFADEAFFVGDKAAVDALLTKITEPVIRIEAKFRPQFETINRMDIWIASNRDHVIPAPTGARRFFVPSFSEEKRLDMAYFEALQEELDSGGREAMLHDLMDRDLTGFNRRKVLVTPGLIEQKQHDLTGFNRWWGDVLYRGIAVIPGGGAWNEWEATSLLFESYQRYEDRNRTYKKMSLVEFGKWMKRFSVKPSKPQPENPEEKRRGGYQLGGLTVARARFDELLEVSYDWPEVEAEPPAAQTASIRIRRAARSRDTVCGKTQLNVVTS